MKHALAVGLMLVGLRAEAMEPALLGKWEVLESLCSDGSMNRASIPTLLRSYIKLNYEFTPEAFHAVVDFIDVPVAQGKETCTLSFSADYASLQGNLKLVNTKEVLTNCQGFQAEEMSHLITHAVRVTEVMLSPDQQELLLISNVAEPICGAGVKAFTRLKRLN